MILSPDWKGSGSVPVNIEPDGVSAGDVVRVAARDIVHKVADCTF